MTDRNGPCWCGSGKKWKKCHYPKEGISTDPEALRKYYFDHFKILLKTQKQIQGIRAACRLSRKILEETCKQAKAGVTTNELNDFAHKLHLEAGAIPAPLHYGTPPFPKSICTSLNDVICHGIPDDIPLEEGDILNIDVTCILNGFYGDCSNMVTIGNISPDKKRVTDVSLQCLYLAIAELKPGLALNQIGEIIETHADSKGCSVVNQFVGHGTGIYFHENPQVFHNRNHLTLPLVPGMTFTIEPMINAGVKEHVMDANQWTARTRDGKPSAQWEHTVLITEDGHEILTE